MVLFIEDEKRIKEMEKREKLAKRTRLGVWLRRFFKIGLVLAALFAMSIVILAMIGGDNAALKKGIEDYLTQSFGIRAEIGVFNEMSFFPDLHLDIADITFRKKDRDDPVFTVKTAEFTAGFFDMMFTRKRFKTLTLKNLNAEAGIFGEQNLVINTLSLQENEGERPALVLDGRYGADGISAALTMEREKETYRVAKNGNFKASFGNIRIHGDIESASRGGIEIKNAALRTPDTTLSGDLSLRHSLTKNSFTADISFGSSSTLQATIKTNEKQISGDLFFPVLALADIRILSQIQALYQKLAKQDSHKDRPIAYQEKETEFKIKIDELRALYGDLGHVSIAIKGGKNQLFEAMASGKISGGDLASTIRLNTEIQPASLTVDASLKDWDYGHYQSVMFDHENVSGKADIRMSLTSAGKTYNALLQNLAGEAVLIAGKGTMASAALDIWGAGLVNAMLPSLDENDRTTLNCMIADFKIRDSIATAEPFFLDTSRITVIGEGQINIFKNTVDLKLEPKAKNPALLDGATAVRLTGSSLHPTITTDRFSLFEKPGGFAPGIVNPAFFVFSMTDLGLIESHPCYEFIGHPEKEGK